MNHPTLNGINNVVINENAGQQTVSLGGITSGAANESQTLTVTASSSNPSLIPNPTVSYTTPNTTGSLAFTPATLGFGSATITVTVNDGGTSNNIITQTFTVTVNAVNQTPTLNAINNLAINENAGVQTVSLSGISSGAPNENQTLTVTATSSNTNTGLIPNPTVAYTSPNGTGSLAFTPVANASGSATVTVTVNDGGNSNNIVTRTFTVTVNAVNQPPTISQIDDQATLRHGYASDSLHHWRRPRPPRLEPRPLRVVRQSDRGSDQQHCSPAAADSNRTVTITPPAAGQDGSANITVIVSDGSATASTTFQVSIAAGRPVNTPPTISAIADQTVSQNTATPAIPFMVGDVETAATNLVVSATSSDTNLLPTAGILLGGAGTNRTVTATPGCRIDGTAHRSR